MSFDVPRPGVVTRSRGALDRNRPVQPALVVREHGYASIVVDEDLSYDSRVNNYLGGEGLPSQGFAVGVVSESGLTRSYISFSQDSDRSFVCFAVPPIHHSHTLP